MNWMLPAGRVDLRERHRLAVLPDPRHHGDRVRARRGRRCVWFLWKYRARPGRKAHYTHGNVKAEVIWTVVPAVIVVVHRAR